MVQANIWGKKLTCFVGWFRIHPIAMTNTAHHATSGLDAHLCNELYYDWGMGSDDLDGVMTFAPDGTPIGRIALPERCANLCFGGRANSRIFTASSTSIYALYVNVSGVVGG